MTEGSIEFDKISFGYPDGQGLVFDGLDLVLPRGIVSFMGQNGTGKSTLLLLAAGNLLPDLGNVKICGKDTTDLQDERERQKWVSLIFQNMEFQTEEVIGDLLPFVYEGGFHEKKDPSFVNTLTEVFGLETCLNRKTQEVSKGELQRTILAFSLLYGSRVLLMDEPIFALEYRQKERVMDFITSYAREQDLPVYYSVHELDISQKYSDSILLFYKNGGMELGSTDEMLTRDILEEAYEYPYGMLKRQESLFRDTLKQMHVRE